MSALRCRIFASIGVFACTQVFAADPLPALGAEKTATVSGLSSGGDMAVQMHVAHSSIVKGAGAMAGGSYYCAQNSLWTAYYNDRLSAPRPAR